MYKFIGDELLSAVSSSIVYAVEEVLAVICVTHSTTLPSWSSDHVLSCHSVWVASMTRSYLDRWGCRSASRQLTAHACRKEVLQSVIWRCRSASRHSTERKSCTRSWWGQTFHWSRPGFTIDVFLNSCFSVNCCDSFDCECLACRKAVIWRCRSASRHLTDLAFSVLLSVNV